MSARRARPPTRDRRRGGGGGGARRRHSRSRLRRQACSSPSSSMRRRRLPSAGHTLTTYTWNFGDGLVTDLACSATHAFAAAGTFTVTLTVTDDIGQKGTLATPVIVTPAGAGTPDGRLLNLSDRSNQRSVGDLQREPVVAGRRRSRRIDWDFGDGVVVNGQPGFVITPHVFHRNWEYLQHPADRSRQYRPSRDEGSMPLTVKSRRRSRRQVHGTPSPTDDRRAGHLRRQLHQRAVARPDHRPLRVGLRRRVGRSCRRPAPTHDQTAGPVYRDRDLHNPA